MCAKNDRSAGLRSLQAGFVVGWGVAMIYICLCIKGIRCGEGAENYGCLTEKMGYDILEGS